ncbi:hypothetical protein [Stenotrophobium rhamnosiphilum]|uniref:Uncharacterized protein n=1 Tax=Stenotrophobium rhamnosiphilum TaxID=2029166 RepID=A0A2T5MEA0_9GAMM|nr:hypothetical protein [Stenotrophobium rhamnosiphilum]PTU30911.1 hypothetical protein CJD38_11405 [Stenotrophobium rhamnosiphilum]
MFKKIIQASAVAILLASTFSAIAADAPIQTVYPVKAKMTMVTSVNNPASGSAKLVTITLDNKKLIRMTMGLPPDIPALNEQHWVLGFVPVNQNLSNCKAAIVVWDKVREEINGELATAKLCESTGLYLSAPVRGKNSTARSLDIASFTLVTPGGCSQSKNSLHGNPASLSGLSDYSFQASSHISTKQTLVQLFGEVLETNTETHGLIKDGSFSVNVKKPLGSAKKLLAMNCEPEE